MLDQNKLALLRKMADSERLQKLRALAATSPLKPYVLGCIVCGADSDGAIRCKKHKKRYNSIWYEEVTDFVKLFEGQE